MPTGTCTRPAAVKSNTVAEACHHRAPCRAWRSVSLSMCGPPPGQLREGRDQASSLFSEHQGQSLVHRKPCPSSEETCLPSSFPRHVFHSHCLVRWRHKCASNPLRVCIASACSFNLICARPGRHFCGSVGRSGKCNCGPRGNPAAPPGSGSVCVPSLTFFWVWGCWAGLGCIIPPKGCPPRSPKKAWAPEGCCCVAISVHSVTCRCCLGDLALGPIWELAPGLCLEPRDLGHQRVSQSWALRAGVPAGGWTQQGSQGSRIYARSRLG